MAHRIKFDNNPPPPLGKLYTSRISHPCVRSNLRDITNKATPNRTAEHRNIIPLSQVKYRASCASSMAHLVPIFSTLAPPTPPDVMTYEIPPASPVQMNMDEWRNVPLASYKHISTRSVRYQWTAKVNYLICPNGIS